MESVDVTIPSGGIKLCLRLLLQLVKDRGDSWFCISSTPILIPALTTSAAGGYFILNSAKVVTAQYARISMWPDWRLCGLRNAAADYCR